MFGVDEISWKIVDDYAWNNITLLKSFCFRMTYQDPDSLRRAWIIIIITIIILIIIIITIIFKHTLSGPLDDLPRLWVLWGGPRPSSDHLSHEDSVREHLHPAHKWVGDGGGDDDGDAYKFRPSKLNIKLKRKAPPWKICINFEQQWGTFILYEFLRQRCIFKV